MPRTFLFSTDPRPNRPFQVTFVIEGTDADGKPLALIGDEYVIAVKAGSIRFDKHALKILSVDEKANHRAKLMFVSQDGFAESGEFKLVCALSRDPIQREETTVTVVAPTIATETASPTTEIVPDHAVNPIDLCFLDMHKPEKTGEPSKTDVPLTETPNPNPVQVPVTTPSTPDLEKLNYDAAVRRLKRLIYVILGLFAVTMIIGIFLVYKYSLMVPSNKVSATSSSDAINGTKKTVQKTTVTLPASTPDVASTPLTHVPQAPAAPEPEVGSDEDEATEEVEEVANPQDQQPAAAAPPTSPAPKCGACP